MGPTDEELFCLEDLRDAWNAQADAVNSWDELGMDEIIWFAQQQALARYARPAITPIPVSGDSPSEADGDKHGRCWAWNPESLWWDYWQPKFIRMNVGDPYTHWLPGDAIPRPTP